MRWARGAAVVALGLGGALFGAWLLGWSSNLDPVAAVKGEPPSVVVPGLEGLARPRAVADVESAGLVADVETSFSLSAPRGAVVAQDPSAGSTVAEGSTVVVTVSRGVSRVEMPDAVGKPLAEVLVPFDEVGVDYVVDRVPSEAVAEGVVLEQLPEPGKRVTAADSISFVVSTGPEPRPVLDVSGLSPEGAAFALGSAGFLIAGIDARADAGVPEGVVVGTEPAAGTVLPRDTPVVLIVSAGPPPVAVPELANRSLDEAVAAIEAVGLVANVVGGDAEGGTVTTQQPAAGTMLEPGSLVGMEVGGA